jgi:hypothetical protein
MDRLTDTGKWKQSWFRELTPVGKIVNLYLLDMCDDAGFFKINPSYDAGKIKITEQEYLDALKNETLYLKSLNDENYLWVRNSIEDQGRFPLNFDNDEHGQIIDLLKDNIKNFAPGSFDKTMGGD